MYIDSHTHIYLDQFDSDIEDAMQRCEDAQVKKLLLPNIDSKTIQRVKALSAKYPTTCYPMMGLHPCSVKENYQDELDILKQELGTGSYIAVGEIGIDLHWDKTFHTEQIDAFRQQIEWSRELKVPFVIHSRDSLDETIDIVTDMQDGHLQGVFHCFNGTVEQAHRIKDVGFYIGIGGVLTFKNAGVDKVVQQLDIDNMILETDAPYLAPKPYRGKRNESSYIPLIAQRLAEVKAIDIKEIEKITTENTLKLFQLDNKV